MIFKRCLNDIKHLVTICYRPQNWLPTNRLSESAYKDLQKGTNHVSPIVIMGKKSLKTIKILSAFKLIRISKINKASNDFDIYYVNFKTTQLGKELINKFCHYANLHQDCFKIWWPILMSTVLISIFIILFEIICLFTGLITVIAIGITIVIAFLCVCVIVG